MDTIKKISVSNYTLCMDGIMIIIPSKYTDYKYISKEQVYIYNWIYSKYILNHLKYHSFEQLPDTIIKDYKKKTDRLISIYLSQQPKSNYIFDKVDSYIFDSIPRDYRIDFINKLPIENN